MSAMDNVSVCSGPQSDIDFEDFDKPKEESKRSVNRLSNAQRLSRVMIQQQSTTG